MSRARIVSAVVIAATTWAPLSAAAKPPSAKNLEFFERRVRPLLVRRCYKCHSKQSKPIEGGLRLDRSTAIRRGGDSGPAIVEGRPNASRLIEAVRYTNAKLQMPPRSKLPPAEIAILVEWVRLGAALPRDRAGDKPQSVRDMKTAREFWSFQPLQPVTAPRSTRADSWARGRIDHFIHAGLKQHDLAPSAEADRRTLVRRLSFDLLGLPPTSGQVDRFITDTRPDAYEHLVDVFLASPHHGEHWARGWLDLARYSDTTASWLKSTAGAWRYRDWVVEAINSDLPFDEFVRRQLAADQVPGLPIEQRRALGFLGLSPTYWKEPRLAPGLIKVVVAEEWEERIDTIGRTFLGLTLACARCHDHKFDPVNQADYYALAGVLASTRLFDQPLLPADRASVVRDADRRIDKLERAVTQVSLRIPAPGDKQQQIARLKARIEQIKKSTPDFDAPRTHSLEDASLFVLADGQDMTRLEYRLGEVRDLAIHQRGNPSSLGPVVPRRFLEVLSQGKIRPFRNGSGRLELANALVDSRQGGSLTARVIVNRIWREHFGHGLVTTPSNFGFQGERPSHPELLEDLAGRFIDNGWSLKWLHRELVLSATYRQASRSAGPGRTIDPDNRWLGRMNRRRLSIEAWRDAMLTASGELDMALGGPARTVDNPKHRRRTLYSTINRRELDTMLRLYDFPSPTGHSPKRVRTITPLQQLFVLNSPFIIRQSALIASRIPGGPRPRIAVDRLHRLLFDRTAGPGEIQTAVEFLAAAGPRGWPQYIQVLLGSNEFVFVD
ncbi:MAG: PSD1 and planctomycete cytochrome C domain-containing protein [Planctomycetaceae bacterium]|nr:PSD1 and planctomycete cytochrome C domain-containing protein [Planctomycetaceae bacterium]